MIRMLKRMGEDGAAAIEMAVAVPVLVTMIIGIVSIGQLFMANAGMAHALGQGARAANICSAQGTNGCTLPTTTTIIAKMNSDVFGKWNGLWDTPQVDSSTASSGYITLTVGYHQNMFYGMSSGPAINLSRSKRVYLADTPPTSADCDGYAAASKPPACSIYTTT